MNRHVAKATIIISLCAVGVLFLATPYAHALVEETVVFVMNKVFYFIFSVSANLLSLLVQWLNFSINFQVDPNIPVVESTWKIVRDFSNMFFIVIMIVMAFATILKVSWLSAYDPGKLMVQFIVAALLINFSLVICGIIISGTQSLNAIFITAIGDFGDRMGQFLDPGQWVMSPSGKDLTTTPQLFFASVIIFIVDFSLLVAIVFTYIRVPFLWLLMILSPIALLTNILPSTKGAFTRWWQEFIRWNFFLPIFLAVLYLGMFFLSQQDAIIGSVIRGNIGTSGEFVAGLNVSIQTLFFYSLIAFLLIAGTNAAVRGSLVTGMGAVAGAKWARDFALSRTGVGALGTAAKDRFAEIKKEGYGRIPGTQFKVFGGPAPLTETAGKLFGVKKFEQQALITGKLKEERKTLEDEQRSIAELRDIMQKDKGYRGLAAGELLLKDKKLRVGEVEELRGRYANLKTPNGVAEKGFRERAQAQLEDMAENDRFKNEDDFKKALELLPEGGTDGFLRKAKKGNVNPIWIAQAQKIKNEKALSSGKADDGTLLSEEERAKLAKPAEELVREALQKMAPKDLLKLSATSLRSFTHEPYRTTLENWLTKDKIEAIMKNEEMNDEKIRVLDPVIIAKQGREFAREIARIENDLAQIRSRRDALQQDFSLAERQKDQERMKILNDRLRGMNELASAREKAIEEIRTKQREAIPETPREASAPTEQPPQNS